MKNLGVASFLRYSLAFWSPPWHFLVIPVCSEERVGSLIL